MSSEVISGAGPTIQRMRSPMRERASSSASTAISSGVAPPRLLRSATCGPGPMRAQPVDHHGPSRRGRRRSPPARSRPRHGCRAQFGLAQGDPVLLGRARDGAGVERHADGDDARDHRSRGGGDRLEIGARLGQRAGDLVDEQRARHAARLRQVGQRHVVVHDHHVDLEPKARARSAARPKFSRSPV
jgi:hypothetical protein